MKPAPWEPHSFRSSGKFCDVCMLPRGHRIHVVAPHRSKLFRFMLLSGTAQTFPQIECGHNHHGAM